MTSRKSDVPAGLRFNAEKADARKAKGQYTKVVEGGKTSTLTITGAARQFEQHPDMVYVPEVAVAGRREDVRRALAMNPATADRVDDLMASAYTASNFERDAEFNAEVDAAVRRRERASSRKVDYKVDLDQVSFLADNLKSAKVVGVEKKSRGKARRGNVEPLSKRLADAVEKGRLLNVTHIKKVSDIAGKDTKLEELKPRSKNYGDTSRTGLPMVSANLGAYKRALAMLVADKDSKVTQAKADKLIAKWTKQRDERKRAKSPRARSPRAKSPRAKSPARTSTRSSPRASSPRASPRAASPRASPRAASPRTTRRAASPRAAGSPRRVGARGGVRTLPRRS